MNTLLRTACLTTLAILTSACSFHSTATRWNGRVDMDGKPVFVKTTTNVGVNLAIALPLLGATTIDDMVHVTTRDIASQGSDGVRVIQTSSENYWYGFPPFTWVLTPVITSVAMEYTPSEQEIKMAAEQAGG